MPPHGQRMRVSGERRPGRLVRFAAVILLATGSAGSLRAAPPEHATLPRYFTVELGSDGVLMADGRLLDSRAGLEQAVRRAADSRQFVGAAVYAESEREREGLAALLGQAGFSVVRAARRGPLMAARRVDPSRAPAAAAAPPEAAPSVQRPSVQLSTVGLHVGGASYDEPSRKRLVRLFEAHFGRFQGCYALANDRSQNASFGVDLLVPTKGGPARVRQVRSRLSGQAFRECMRRAFEAIRFEPPPAARPESVSYSLLFKPQGPTPR